jgi:hypothetical protein
LNVPAPSLSLLLALQNVPARDLDSNHTLLGKVFAPAITTRGVLG